MQILLQQPVDERAPRKLYVSPFPRLPPRTQGKQLSYLLGSHIVQEKEEVHYVTTVDAHTCLHLFQILGDPRLQNGSLLPASAKTHKLLFYYCTVISNL